LIADEFGRQGWDYDLSVGRELVKHVTPGAEVDPNQLAQAISATFLQKNHTTRDAVRSAIQQAIVGFTLVVENPAVTSLVVHGNNHSLTLGDNASISGNLNVGGTQIVIADSASKEELLDGVAALVRAGLTGELNADAARALGDVIAARNDIDIGDVESVAFEVVKIEKPTEGRVRSLMASLSTQALSGALAIGLASGLGQALPLLAHLV
jgi:hypothetical protein